MNINAILKQKARRLNGQKKKECIHRLNLKQVFDINNKCLDKINPYTLFNLYNNLYGQDFHEYFEQRQVINQLKRDKLLSTKSYVYFLVNEYYGFCKIGKSINPHKRLGEVQTGCPFELVVRGMIEGDKSVERALHLQFKKQNTYGEWFKIEGDFEKYLDELFPIEIKLLPEEKYVAPIRQPVSEKQYKLHKKHYKFTDSLPNNNSKF